MRKTAVPYLALPTCSGMVMTFQLPRLYMANSWARPLCGHSWYDTRGDEPCQGYRG